MRKIFLLCALASVAYRGVSHQIDWNELFRNSASSWKSSGGSQRQLEAQIEATDRQIAMLKSELQSVESAEAKAKATGKPFSMRTTPAFLRTELARLETQKTRLRQHLEATASR